MFRRVGWVDFPSKPEAEEMRSVRRRQLGSGAGWRRLGPRRDFDEEKSMMERGRRHDRTQWSARVSQQKVEEFHSPASLAQFEEVAVSAIIRAVAESASVASSLESMP